ncbi:hypothetical protein Tco_0303677 [Tanacetum coccineum]
MADPEEVFSNHKILEVVRITTYKKYGLDFLEEIIVKRDDNKPFSFSKADFKYLSKNDIEDMYYLCLNGKVRYRKLKLLEDFYVTDMEKDHMCPLLVGRRFVATASAILDCKKSKIVVPNLPFYLEKDFINTSAHGEWEIDMDVDLNPFKDILVFRKIVEFLGAILINLKGNMWESKDMIEKKRIRTSHQKK